MIRFCLPAVLVGLREGPGGGLPSSCPLRPVFLFRLLTGSPTSSMQKDGTCCAANATAPAMMAQQVLSSRPGRLHSSWREHHACGRPTREPCLVHGSIPGDDAVHRPVFSKGSGMLNERGNNGETIPERRLQDDPLLIGMCQLALRAGEDQMSFHGLPSHLRASCCQGFCRNRSPP